MKNKLLNLNLVIALILSIHTGVLAHNPLLEPFNTPHGIIPFEKVELEHILPAFEVALEEDRKQAQAIIDNPQPATFENTIAALERVGQKGEMIFRYARALGSAYSNPELNQIVAEVSRLGSDYFNEMLFNEKLFERVRKVYLACIIHAFNLGQMQGAESRRHSGLFQGFRNEADGPK